MARLAHVLLFVIAATITAACESSSGTAQDAAVDLDSSGPGDDMGAPDQSTSDVADAAAIDSEPPRPDMLVDDSGPDSGPLSWQVEVVEDSPGFKARAALAVGADNSHHLAYNIASDPEGWYKPDVWYAYRKAASGSWQKSKAMAAKGLSNEFPSLLVDANGKVHIFFNRYFEAEDQIDILHVSSEDYQTFSPPENVTSTNDADEYAVTLTQDGAGTIHMLAQRSKDAKPSVVYLTLAGDQPSAIEDVAIDTGGFSLNPGYAIAVGSDGTVYAIYSRQGATELDLVLYLRQRTAGVWQPEITLSASDGDAWGPAIGLDANNVAHIVYVGDSFMEKTLTYDRLSGGALLGAQTLTSSTEDRSYYLGLQVAPDGTVHIAFKRYYQGPDANNADVFYITGKNGTFLPEQRITDTPDLDEDVPAIALGNSGEVLISFTENFSSAPNGKVYLATGK